MHLQTINVKMCDTDIFAIILHGFRTLHNALTIPPRPKRPSNFDGKNRKTPTILDHWTNANKCPAGQRPWSWQFPLSGIAYHVMDQFCPIGCVVQVWWTGRSV